MSDQGVIEEPGRVGELRLLGERLCLDFANTVDPRHSDHPREFLTDYADLVVWGRHTGVLTAQGTDALLDGAAQRPDEAAATFQRARALRQALYRVFAALAAGTEPPAVDLDALNRAHAAAMAHARVVPAAGGYGWGWEELPGALDRMLWPVLRDAGELLTAGRLDRIRECPGLDGCGWLFLDTSKNGSRRWCSMEGCGNRAKGRRHYRRKRASADDGSDSR